MWIVKHLAEGFCSKPLSKFRHCVYAFKSHHKNKNNKFVKIIAVAQQDLSWILICSQTSIKFSNWENLMLFWMRLNKALRSICDIG